MRLGLVGFAEAHEAVVGEFADLGAETTALSLRVRLIGDLRRRSRDCARTSRFR